MYLIEGSLYTSKGLLLCHIVNTIVILIFSLCLLSLSLSYSVFPCIFSFSFKSMTIILNHNGFTDFSNTNSMLSCSAGIEQQDWESRVITLFVCVQKKEVVVYQRIWRLLLTFSFQGIFFAMSFLVFCSPFHPLFSLPATLSSPTSSFYTPLLAEPFLHGLQSFRMQLSKDIKNVNIKLTHLL